RKTKELVGFEVGTRETKYFEILSKNIAHIKAEKYASDNWEAYNLIDPNKRLIGKAHTYTVERMNRLLRYYWARFTRKTYCSSKSLSMISDFVLLFLVFSMS
ncbi:MAG: IS1 family transposase, partial [Clostridia bacterium]|nr:IS1 family transposase [Clostridia bacterium]